MLIPGNPKRSGSICVDCRQIVGQDILVGEILGPYKGIGVGSKEEASGSKVKLKHYMLYQLSKSESDYLSSLLSRRDSGISVGIDTSTLGSRLALMFFRSTSRPIRTSSRTYASAQSELLARVRSFSAHPTVSALTAASRQPLSK